MIRPRVHSRGVVDLLRTASAREGETPLAPTIRRAGLAHGDHGPARLTLTRRAGSPGAARGATHPAGNLNCHHNGGI